MNARGIMEQLGPDPHIATEAGEEALVERQTRLRFYLGELRLAVFAFPTLVYPRPFTKQRHHSLVPRNVLRNHPGVYRAVVFPSQVVVNASRRLAFLDGCLRYVPVSAPRLYVTFSGRFSDYVQSNFDAKQRHNLTRTVRKFDELNSGKPSFRRFTKVSEMAAYQRLARTVAECTYQEHSLRVALPGTTQFLEQLEAGAEHDRVRGYVLFHQAKPVAYAHCSFNEDVLEYQIVGYDPAYAKWSPGTVLLYHILADQFSEGRASVLDFGTGESPYKTHFATHRTWCSDVYYFTPTISNVMLILAHTLVDYISVSTGKLLECLRVKSAVRGLMRRWRGLGS
jgi:hypothetical protein